jgi:hypothetical protein
MRHQAFEHWLDQQRNKRWKVVGWGEGEGHWQAKWLGQRGPVVNSYEEALEIASDPKHKEWGVHWTVVSA